MIVTIEFFKHGMINKRECTVDNGAEWIKDIEHSVQILGIFRENVLSIRKKHNIVDQLNR